MMQHYVATKKEYPDCILFYRLGDFYEMFFEDAVTVSRELDLTLTGKNCGMKERAPMCGVPYHTVETYINRLIERGHKVAICEQVEDAKLVNGMVQRKVIRVVTPGTVLDIQRLDETKNNYIMCIVFTEDRFGISLADITTGQCMVTEVDKERKLLDEIYKFMPVEIICNHAFLICGDNLRDLRERLHITVYELADWYFDDTICRKTLENHFGCKSLQGLGLNDFKCGTIAAGVLFQYLYEIQKSNMGQMTSITPYVSDRFMLLDNSSRRNLELVETLREKQKRGSLLWVLDKTKTAMGARMLRSFVEQPLINKEKIEYRLEAVEELNEQPIIRDEIRVYLQPVYDLERLISRITYQSANPRDLLAFKTSLQMLPYIKQLLNTFHGSLLQKIQEDLDSLEDLYQLIEESIIDDPPLAIKEGGILKDGYHEMVDHFREAKNKGKQWISELESEEREKTGIRNLKVKYNKVFGYYLEVTNSFKNFVPTYYTRKQTLANAERYTTDRLKDLEEEILGAEDKLSSLEYELFCTVRDRIAGEVLRIQKTARAIATLDVFASFSYVAQKNRFVRPKLNQKGKIDIHDGRHPVVEQMIPNDMFISNDTYLDNEDHRIAVITGANMAGKSTYMRQTALIVLMAQIGSFVPASSVNIGIVDRIFTRVGASDDLSSGQSTFMMEMTEVASILRNATSDSLLILDEIGRGTNTFDGLSIAWAVIEHIADIRILGAKTLFATHYYELTELEGKLPGIHNYCIAVKEKGDDIVFLRKIVQSRADKSYGIQVARLAGIPESVLARAKELVAELTDANNIATMNNFGGVKKLKAKSANSVSYDAVKMTQMSLFDMVKDHDIIDELETMNIFNMTPLDALNTLFRLQNKLRNWDIKDHRDCVAGETYENDKITRSENDR
ncbi:MAG: DNA mismatch repair protein MutS [Lachnospiraceae bacterium]|nr:DNA mismatch repair protein MutS [Lachnospiraceae bacterium]